ncbi:unnamed protein product, partial [Staurois parvus]
FQHTPNKNEKTSDLISIWYGISVWYSNDRGAIPPTDTNDGALFLPLTPMMGHYSSTDTNDGALFLPLIPMMGHYCSH